MTQQSPELIKGKARIQLRARVAELEAERPDTFREEWGVRWADGPEIELRDDERDARSVHRQYPEETTLIRREVRELITPWRDC